MNEQEAEGTTLKEHLIWHEQQEDKLAAILEYVRDIPSMKADIKMLKADMREVNVRLGGVELRLGKVEERLDNIVDG